MKIEINVLPGDILFGEKDSANCCPIALAAGRSIPSYHITVTHHTIGLTKNSTYIKGELPDIAKGCINKFDAGKDVAPFSFEVEIG